jgi:hypothetical protein
MTVAASLKTILGVGLIADVRLTPLGNPSDGHDCCQKVFLLGPSAAIAFAGVALRAGALLKPLLTGEPVPAISPEDLEILPGVLTDRFRASDRGTKDDAPTFLLAIASPLPAQPDIFCVPRTYVTTGPDFTFREEAALVAAIGSGSASFRSLAQDDPNLSFHALQGIPIGRGISHELADHFYDSEKVASVGGLVVQVEVRPGASHYVQRGYRVVSGHNAGQGWSLSADTSGRFFMTDMASGRIVPLAFPWESPKLVGSFDVMEKIVAPRREALRRTPAGGNHLVFDWYEAARLIRDRRPTIARAGLDGLDDTWATIYRDGKPVKGSGRETAVLASSTHIPCVELDGARSPCWAAKHERPRWDADTNWPEGSEALVERGRVHATFGAGSSGAPDRFIRELHGIAVSDSLGCWWYGLIESKDSLFQVTMTHTPPDPADRQVPPDMRREHLKWVSSWATPEAIVEEYRQWMESLRSSRSAAP